MKLHLSKNIDRVFLVIYVALCIIAIIATYSASSVLIYQGKSSEIVKQMLLVVGSIGLVYVVQLFPSYIYRVGGYLLFGVSLLCLYYLFLSVLTGIDFPGVVNINGEKRWLRLGLTFQPSELAKLSLIIVVSDLLSRMKTEEDYRKYFFLTLGITALTALPILATNLSTTLLLCGIVFLLWILARIPFKYWGTVAGIAVAVLVLGYCIAEFGFVQRDRSFPGPMKRAETWVHRIDDWLGIGTAKTADFAAESDKVIITDYNRQEVYAKVAIARGTFVGVGPGKSKERDYLPLAFADYIFAIVVEESGWIGILALIALYLITLFRACNVSTRYEDKAAMLMVMGLALMISCQALVSMLVTVGIGPVTGQPLPLVSKGGTSVLFTGLYFGIMMGVSREQKSMQVREERAKTESADEVPDDIVVE